MVDNMYYEEELKSLRREIFVLGYKGGMAHLASCFSCIEILYTLYVKHILNYSKDNCRDENRDRLILSKGHAGLALFTVLEKVGLISSEELSSYLQPGSHIGGEPCMRDSAVIEATTGSLGHGLSMGVGMAMALKADQKTAKVYVILGDGELEEGTVWEAAMTACAYKLNNLIAILDCNKIQKMDKTKKIIGIDNWKEKWEAFGWDVLEADGHDIDILEQTFKKENNTDKPRIIIANTIKGKGISIMENKPNWHFKLPNEKELKVFIDELGITEEDLVK